MATSEQGDRSTRVRRLFHAAAELPPEARAEYLAEACGGDAGIRAEVEGLLAAWDGSESHVDRVLDGVGQPLPADDSSEPETDVSRLSNALGDGYRLIREIGRGGMATVYLADDRKHDRQVAIKVLRPELSEVLGAARFLSEIKTTAGLQHPHILPLYDSGEADGFLYYVMPFVEGESLRKRLDREKQLPVDEAVRIATEVAGALDHAHARGIVHRDIKPANVLLRDGRAYVADFGIAFAVDAAGGDRLTTTGLSLGTPAYMSPEQATGTETASARSDIWALGCVLYEMLVGEAPYAGATPQSILGRIVTEDPRPVSAERKSVPPNVEAAVARALEKIPADRFGSAEEMARALGDPGFQHTGSGSSTSGEVWRRMTLALAIASTALAGALGWALVVRSPERSVGKQFVEFPEDEAFLAGLFGTGLAVSPDGSRLVYQGQAFAGSPLWMKRTDSLRANPIAETEGGHQPFFSPDGRSIGWIEAGVRTLSVLELGGGAPRILDRGVAQAGATWGTDGYIYYMGRIGSGIWRVPATGGSPDTITVLDHDRGELSHRWPHALPDVGAVLFMVEVRNGDPEIWVVDVSTRERKMLVPGVTALYSPTGHLLWLQPDGTLMAGSFNPRSKALALPGTPVASGLHVGSNPNADVALSAQGTLLYVQRAASGTGVRQRIVRVGLDGSVEEIDPDWTEDLSDMAVSPDGRSVAVEVRESSGQESIWIKPVDGGPATRLTFDSQANWPFAWRGEQVIYHGVRGATQGLWSKSADGVGEPTLLVATDRPVFGADWSPQGEWLVFSLAGEDIYAVRGTDGVSAPLLAEADRSEQQPDISPDGRWIAYVSDQSGRDEVYVRPFPNVEGGVFLASTDGGRAPKWSSDGRVLYFVQPGQPPLMVVRRLTDDTALGLEAPEALFPLEGLGFAGVLPDGEGFIMVTSSASLQPTWLLVQVDNFFSELEEKMGR